MAIIQKHGFFINTREELAEKTPQFDNYVQIIDGAAHLYINQKEFTLKLAKGL